MMSLTYQTGRLLDPKEHDPEFPSFKDAAAHAIKESALDRYGFFAIWTGQDHGSELEAIVFRETIFRS
jgi:hypothetical protein